MEEEEEEAGEDGEEAATTAGLWLQCPEILKEQKMEVSVLCFLLKVTTLENKAGWRVTTGPKME